MKYLKYIDQNVTSQKGKVFVVTGANSGIGYEVTKQLVYKSAKVIMACRSTIKANTAKEEILKEFSDADIEIFQYDQASFDSINQFVDKIKGLKIDGLFLNAGTFHPKNGLRTNDGFPLTVGTNYIGEYYLIHKLNDSILANNIKRIVLEGSVVHILGKTRKYRKYLLDVTNHPNKTYNVSKRMVHDFAINLKQKYPNLEVVLMHPGIADTNIISQQTSSYKKWFSAIAHKFLKIAANPKEKSAICGLFGLTKEIKKPLETYYPRGIFHFVGYPKNSSIKIEKNSNQELEKITREILNL